MKEKEKYLIGRKKERKTVSEKERKKARTGDFVTELARENLLYAYAVYICPNR